MLEPGQRIATRRRAGGAVTAVVVAVLIAGGCRPVRQVVTQPPRPELARIYATSTPLATHNPVVVIPGFGGSELVRESDGKVIWGSFFTPDSLGYGNEEGFRGFGLDIGGLPATPRPEDLAHVVDDARATAPLARVRADALVTDLVFEVYGTLFQLLDLAGYRIVAPWDDTDETTDDESAGSAPLCFTFVYDWRQDGAANAILLGRFLEQARERVVRERRAAGLPPQPVRFDVVAHSMGGLIARYYLRYGARDVLGEPTPPPVTWAGAEQIDRLVLISTPNFGSMKVLRDMVHGRGHAVLPRLQSSLATSLVSAYQMLPRPHHDLWRDEDGRPTTIDLYDVAIWRDNRWGPFGDDQERFLAWLYPDAADADERRERIAAFMTAALERARRFAAALDRIPPRPPPTTQVLFASDARPTRERALVTRTDGRIELTFDGPPRLGLDGPGDGTVTRASALADLRFAGADPGRLSSPIAWNWTVFVSDKHTSLLGNRSFQNNLLHLLLERSPPPRDVAPVRTTPQ